MESVERPPLVYVFGQFLAFHGRSGRGDPHGGPALQTLTPLRGMVLPHLQTKPPFGLLGTLGWAVSDAAVGPPLFLVQVVVPALLVVVVVGGVVVPSVGLLIPGSVGFGGG